jgi:hypothetical protein
MTVAKKSLMIFIHQQRLTAFHTPGELSEAKRFRDPIAIGKRSPLWSN